MDEARNGDARRRRRRAALTLAVFLAVAVFYVASIPGVLVINPDSAIYLSLGRSLARGEGYTIQGQAYGKFPPLFPLMLSAVYATVGESYWWLQFVPALCGIAGVVAVFFVLRPRVGWGPALMIAVLTALSMFYQSHSLLVVRSDVPYTLASLVALGLAGWRIRAERFRLLAWLAVGTATAAAVYVHLSGVALVPAIAAAALLARGQRHGLRQRLAAAVVVGVVGAGAAGLWMWRSRQVQRGRGYGAHVAMLQGEEMDELVLKLELRPREWTAAPLDLVHEEVTLATALVAWALLLLPGYVHALVRRRGTLEFYLPAYFVLSTVAGGPGGHERYVIPIVPLLYYYGYLSLKLDGRALGALWLRASGAKRPGAIVRRLPRIVVVTAAVLLFADSVYSRAKARRGLEKFEGSKLVRQDRMTAEWERVAAWIHEHVPGEARIYPGSGGSWGVATHFVRNHFIMPQLSDFGPWLLQSMHEKGAAYVLVDVHPRSRERLDHILWKYRGRVFTRLHRDGRLSVYHINRDGLAKAIEELEAEGAFHVSREQVAREHMLPY